jgi:hypothetical protein
LDNPHLELLRKHFSLHPGGLNPVVPREVFAKAGGWNGRHKRPAPAPAPEEAREVIEMAANAVEAEPAEKKREVKLMNLRWDRERAFFEETAMASAEAEVPSSCSHLTRIVFSLFACGPDGSREHIAEADAHLREGKAEVEFELTRPRRKGKPAQAAEYVFTAKHARSKTVESPPLQAHEGDTEFRGMIFYSPSRDQYLVLNDPEAIDFWLKEIDGVERLRGRTARAWEMPDPTRRREALDAIGEETVKLFGEKGTVAHSKGALDELLLIKKDSSIRTLPSWIFVPRHERGGVVEVKGHWRKRTDKTVQRELDKLLRGNPKDPCPWFKAQMKLALFKREPMQNQVWEWKREDKDHDGGFRFSSQAAVLRYAMGWEGVEGVFDLKKKKIAASTSAQATFSAAEGELSGTWMWPCEEGIDLLPFLLCMGYPVQAATYGKECRLRVSIRVGASAFAGVSLRGALTFPSIDMSDGWRKTSGSASLEGSFFAGAQANTSLRIAAEWAPSLKANFETLAMISCEVGGSAGLAAEGKISIELKEKRFRFRMYGGLAFGLGLRESVMFDASVAAGYHLIAHLFHCIDHKWLDEITSEAFDEYRKYASALLHQGGALAESGMRDLRAAAVAAGRATSFAKACVRESAGLRTLLAGTPPAALAEALETLMETPEAADFHPIVLMLNACGPNQLLWTLRHLAVTPMPFPGDPALAAWKEKALADGKRRILDFAKDVKGLERLRRDYFFQVTDVFARNGV